MIAHRREVELARRGAPTTPAVAREPDRLVVLDDAGELARHAADLDALAAHAIEPNPFYESWMLLPAFKTLTIGERIALVLVYSQDRRLIGFFPLERRRWYAGLPVASLRMAGHRHCFLRTPLVHRQAVDTCIATIMRWFERSGCSVLEFGCLPTDGAVRQSLTKYLRAARSLDADSYDTYERASFRPGPNARTYLQRALSGKRRKEYRRQLARLSELGRVEFRAVAPGQEQAWIASFLELEQSGWKGRNGSAFASSRAGRCFFQESMGAAAIRRQLKGLGLYLNDEPIALSCKIGSGDGAFAFKIAFDERYARFSPGALLELAHIERLHAEDQVSWMDSCAAAEHFMANRLWTERRRIETFVVTAGWHGACVQQCLRLSRELAGVRRHVARRLMSPELRETLRGWL